MMRNMAIVLTALLAGCSLAPKFERPESETPVQFKELTPAERGNWKTAQPAEEQPRGEWWRAFHDPTLDQLEADAIAANQTLKAAAARVSQARALVGVAKADRIPHIDAGFGPSRAKPSGTSLGLPPGTDVAPFTTWRGLLTVSYEVDLFGRISDNINAARSDYEGSEATFRSVQLALQADVAQTYFALRETDEELSLLRNTVGLREDSARLLQRRFDLGDIGELDVARARTELATTRSDAIALERQRAQLEHALAVLLGKPPASFALDPAPLASGMPAIPAGLPSSLLERRPDIRQAEQNLIAANADIGVAKAAYFPRISLTAALGFESAALSDLFKRTSRTGAIGADMTLPIFNAGRIRNQVARAEAFQREALSSYEKSILVGFQEVENALIDRTKFSQAREVQASNVAALQRFRDLAALRYKEGATIYLEVANAEQSLFNAQLAYVATQSQLFQSYANLYKAMGGGWVAQVEELAAKSGDALN